MSERLHEVIVIDLNGEHIDHFNTNYVSRIGEEIEIGRRSYNVKRVIHVTGSSYIKIVVSGPYPIEL